MARQEKTTEPKKGVAGWNESTGAGSGRQARGLRRNKLAIERRSRIALLVLLLIVCVACVVCLWPIKKTIKRGLWLKEGTEVVTTVTTNEGGKPSAEELNKAVSAIRDRLGASGISEFSVYQKSDDSIAIDLAKSEDAPVIAKIVGGAGGVQFVRSDELGDADALMRINAGGKAVPVAKDTYKSFMDGSSVSSANVVNAGSGSYAVEIVFNEEGSKKFAEVTKDLAKDTGSIAIVVGDCVVSAPSVSEEIAGGKVYISGDFSAEEAGAIKAALKSEPIDLKFSFGKATQVGPAITKTGLWVLSIGAIVALIVFAVASFVRLGKLGIVPSVGMVVFSVCILGVMAFASRVNMFTLTIPGVGAGMCSAVVTAFALWTLTAHFKARVEQGKSIRGAATSSPRDSLRPLGIPCAVVGVASIVFLFLPVPGLREFGLVAIFGIVCGLAAVFWYGVTLLRILVMGSIQADPASWGLHIAPAKDAKDAAEEDAL